MIWGSPKLGPVRWVFAWAIRIVAVPFAVAAAFGMALFLIADDVERGR